MVRSHGQITGLTRSDLCELFALTPKGLQQILNGADWQRSFLARAKPMPRIEPKAKARAWEEKLHDEAAVAANTQRVERQRTLLAMLPDTRALDRLKEAMLQRAYDLMCEGQPEACDALIEFLPEREVEKMMTAWIDDQDDKNPKSQWH